jgi:hypothetical protein
MRDEKLNYPKWQAPLQEAVLEFDREKLREKTERVETSILERLRELQHGADGHSEKEAMKHALSTLRIIKRDKLGYPDWKSDGDGSGSVQHLPD